MSTLDFARWQFAITSIYHFVFVPLTIGLAPMVAVMQTAWHRTGDPHWLRLTRFFGTALLINFAIGVVTGIVQEFQFGMNWSIYSRFVGDVFGVPLALEALIAFFVESVFLGVWIFGRDRLPRGLHLASIWLVATATNLSAYFIVAANAFMQHPVGVHLNHATGRVELESVVTMLANPTAVVAFAHTVTASFLTAATFVVAVAGWWAVREAAPHRAATATAAGGPALYRPALRLGLAVLLVSGVGVAVSGDLQARMLFEQQPMKMAAAEGLCHTETGVPLSLLAVGSGDDGCPVRTVLAVPNLTSFLVTGDSGTTVRGIDDLAAEQAGRYGPLGVDGSGYVPPVQASYWSFRLMIGLGLGSAVLAAAGLWRTRGGSVPRSRDFGRLALWTAPMPFAANLFGWVFTEIGRQPWIVAPNPTGDPAIRLTTASAVSPYVDRFALTVSLVVFTLLYGALALVWFGLLRRHLAKGADATLRTEGTDDTDGQDTALTFAY